MFFSYSTTISFWGGRDIRYIENWAGLDSLHFSDSTLTNIGTVNFTTNRFWKDFYWRLYCCWHSIDFKLCRHLVFYLQKIIKLKRKNNA